LQHIFFLNYLLSIIIDASVLSAVISQQNIELSTLPILIVFVDSPNYWLSLLNRWSLVVPGRPWPSIDTEVCHICSSPRRKSRSRLVKNQTVRIAGRSCPI